MELNEKNNLAVSEDRNKRAGAKDDRTCAVLIMATIAFSAFGSAVILWILLESYAGYLPERCFEKVRCELLTVEHRYNVSEPSCSDVFTYTWKTTSSPVVYFQAETRTRMAIDCQAALNISIDDASFRNGTNFCYDALDLCSSYYSYFNCAKVLQMNNGAAEGCKTLLPPTSIYEPAVNLVIAILLFSFVLVCYDRQVHKFWQSDKSTKLSHSKNSKMSSTTAVKLQGTSSG